MSKVSRVGIEKYGELCDVISDLAEKGEMLKGAPHGVLISVVDKVLINNDKKTIRLEGEGGHVDLPSECKTKFHRIEGLGASGPYICILSLCNTSEPGEQELIEPAKCFISSIHSTDTWIPLAGDFERELIDKAISNVRHNKHNKVDIKYYKPMSPFVSPVTKKKVTPSLVVGEGESVVFIDIDIDAELSDEKQRQGRYEAMSEIAEVVRIPFSSNQPDLSQSCFHGVSVAAKYSLGIIRGD